MDVSLIHGDFSSHFHDRFNQICEDSEPGKNSLYFLDEKYKHNDRLYLSN